MPLGLPKLTRLDASAREQFIAHLAWHEWGHALSIERCSEEDVANGATLLRMAPAGVREVIRTAGTVPGNTRTRSSLRLMPC